MKSFLSIFTASNNSFGGEDSDEKTILLVRRHPFFVIVRMIFLLLLFFVPIIVGVYFSDFISSHDLLIIFLFVSSLWYIFTWSGIFYALTMYTLDVWIVTDHRVIDSTQNGFFNRTVSELHLSRIQDITVQTKGVIHTFLKFGDLLVQTAGAEERFKFSQIPHPEKVKDEIMKLIGSPSHL